MSVLASETRFVKAEYSTDTSINGGCMSYIPVVTGERNNLFPRVTKAERTAGVTRYRKEFLWNKNTVGDPMYAAVAYLESPSNGDDNFGIALGTHTNTQSDWTSTLPLYIGCGPLDTSLSSGESQVSFLMEDDTFEFVPGGLLHIADKISLSQTIASDVRVGDSVEEIGGTWSKVVPTNDITYPKGTCISVSSGTGKVLTERDTTNEAFLRLQTYLNEDEVVATGDGAAATPTLTDLSSVVNGVVTSNNYLPVVKATCGGVERTVNIASDGTCSGYCSAGELNMSDGTWTTDITFTSAPDNATDVTITYYDKNFSFSGNVATVYLSDTVPSAYSTDGSCIVSGCIEEVEEVKPTASSIVVTSSGGSYDDSTYPPVLSNKGTPYDVWTLTFTSSTAFSLTSTKRSGTLATGNVGTNFNPTNPDTGSPYFTLNLSGFSGSWVSGDTLVFTTYPASLPIIWKQTVPAATPQVSNNLCVVGVYWE